MKNLPNFLVPVLFLFLLSCDKDDPVPSTENNFIANISFPESSSVQEHQQIEITIGKATPCHTIQKVEKNVSGKTFNYNFILVGHNDPCPHVAVQEIVNVDFNPSSTGEHTLKFSINGKLFETRIIAVTE